LQLCAQVGRAIDLALVGECEDEVLQNLSVRSVEPAPGNRLLVTLDVHPPGAEMSREAVLARVEAARGVLVQEAVYATSRRSLPELSFWVVKAEELPPPEPVEGDGDRDPDPG